MAGLLGSTIQKTNPAATNNFPAQQQSAGLNRSTQTQSASPTLPSLREFYANTINKMKNDPANRATYELALNTVTTDPTSPYYNPYSQATTTKVNESNVVRTQKALSELDDINNQIKYWVSRTDRNYSDDEIVSKIDLSKYSTLKTLESDRQKGFPSDLLAPVDYSEDALYGMVWSARNNGQTSGNYAVDSAMNYMGRGNVSPEVNADPRRDATSSMYAPYAVRQDSLSDLEYRYGLTGSFSREWLESVDGGRALLAMADAGDKQAKTDYNRIQTAIENTEKYAPAAKAFNDWMQQKYESGMSWKDLTEGVAGTSSPIELAWANEEIKPAKDLWESTYDANHKELITAIDFDMNGWKNKFEERDAERENALPSSQYESDISNALGASFETPPASSVTNRRDAENMAETREILSETATPEERQIMSTDDGSYNKVKVTVGKAIETGTAGREDAHNAVLASANDYAAKNLLVNMQTIDKLKSDINAFNTYQAFYDKWHFKVMDDPKVQESYEYKTDKAAAEPCFDIWYANKDRGTGAWEEEIAQLGEERREIMQGYSDARNLSGGREDNTVVPLVGFLHSVGNLKAEDFKNQVYDWQEQLADGSDWGETLQYINQTYEANLKNIKLIDDALEMAEAYGVVGEYVEGAEALKTALQNENAMIGFAKVRSKADFDEKIKEFDATNEYKAPKLGGNTAVEIINAYLADPDKATGKNKKWYAFDSDYTKTVAEDMVQRDSSAAGMLEAGNVLSRIEYMTDDEKKTYKYLYATGGEKTAFAYINTLWDALNYRGYKAAVKSGQIEGGKEFVGKNAKSVIINATSGLNFIYNAGIALEGGEIDPYSPNNWATYESQAIRENAGKKIDKKFTNPFWNKVAHLGYDSGMMAADSFAATALGGGNKYLSIAAMGLSAANSTSVDVLMRGGTEEQAVLMGGIAAIAESATEFLPMEELIGSFKKGGGTGKVKDWLMAIVKGTITDAPGEVLSEVIGKVSDDAIMQEASNTVARVEQLINEGGLDPEEAEKIAQKEFAESLLYTAMTAAFSQGVSNTIAFGSGKISSLFGGKKSSSDQTAKSEAVATKEEANETSERGTPREAEAPVAEVPVKNEVTPSMQAEESGSANTAPEVAPEPVIEQRDESNPQETLYYRATVALNEAGKANVSNAERAATLSAVLTAAGVDADVADAVAVTLSNSKVYSYKRVVNRLLMNIGNGTSPEIIQRNFSVAASDPKSYMGANFSNTRKTNLSHKLGERSDVILDKVLEKERAKADAFVKKAAKASATVANLRDADKTAYKKAKEATSKALQAVSSANGKVEKAKADVASAEAAVKKAANDLRKNPADENAAKALTASAEKKAAAQNNLKVAEEAANAANGAYQAAVKEQSEIGNTMMLEARSNAEAQVAERVAAKEIEKQERAKAEAEKQEADRKNSNALSVEADNFVEEYFAGAPDEVKNALRDRYISYDKETKAVTRDTYEFAAQISKKFGLNIKFADSHGIFEGAYKGGNDIVLDKNATQGDVVKRVLVHEIVHAAETSDSYDALANAVLDAFYDGNAEQIQADIDSIARQYSSETGQKGEAVARSELVARRLSEMLSGNQEVMNRLVREKPDVATRIWRAIKEFIGKLAGVKDSELDKLTALEKQLEKALATRNGKGAGAQFMLERRAGAADVVVVEEDILDGVPKREWPKTVRSIMASRFPDGVPVGNNVIRINRDARKEITNSKDTMWLKRNDFETYRDKLRAAANSDEIIKASHDYVNEAPTHERKDRIIDFGRGEVSMRIGGKEYDAEVVVGYDADGNMRLYDFVRMTRTDEKKTDEPFEGNASRDSRADLSNVSVSENGSYVKQISDEAGKPVAEIIRGGATKFSLSSWTEKEKTDVRDSLIAAGYEAEHVDKWIGDVDGVAAIIAGDKSRLDYTADPDQVMLKNNQEYVKTLDASTLCAKRLLYQGTFNEIQHQLPNTVITSDMLLDLLNMMKEAGYESPCGVCYVESRRRHLGKFAEQWLNGRPESKGQKAWPPYNGDYIPTLDELTTTDGLANLKEKHRKTYDDFMKKMSSLGSANPKIVEMRTDYRGDIRKLTKSQQEKIVKIGGLRIQSFSDFETPHLIDTMQAVLDMSGKKLTSQAYSKVPNFAWVFGDTGIKINLSLLAEGSGLDENGNLIFSSSEGIDFNEAMKLRDRYSKDVGTIIVGANDAHIRACMADDRIDYIIPFHRSGWGQNELQKVGVLNSYEDYQEFQNERMLDGSKPKGGNFYPIDYWDYNKTGDENAETYLRMCEEDGRIPKFEQFLEKGEDGRWVAPSGYWKLLIDFKMYDNEGRGAPQQIVQPNFNMEEAVRVLNEYEGGADSLPVAYDIVDKFVADQKASTPSARFSLPSDDILDERIAEYRNGQHVPEQDSIGSQNGNQQQSYGDGERQFAGKTLQESAVVPDWIKREFLRPEELNYETDTNREQVERGWQRIQANGYESERERLLNLDRYSADDTAEANLMMAMALREDTADPATFMALASRYNKEGTKAGQEMQARKLFARMSPIGVRVWAAGQMESQLEEHMRSDKKHREQVNERAENVAEKIRDFQAGDELLRLNAGGDFTINESNNRWGVPINQQQQALIDQYKLNGISRPGAFYNRATIKQRMLEAILATPNPLEATGLGLNLIQRLEYMRDGQAVITNADLNYIGYQLGQFVGAGEEAGGRTADLAINRAYEAYGNIKPVRGKIKSLRYVNMLLSGRSAVRNIIGNTVTNMMTGVNHDLEVVTDAIVGAFTGKRTKAMLSVNERVSGWKAFADETKKTWRDYFVDKVDTNPRNEPMNVNRKARIYQSGLMEASRNLQAYLMSVGDRNYWKRAYVNSMAEQQKLLDDGKLFNDDGTVPTQEQMVERAEYEADCATLSENNLVSETMGYIARKNPAIADILSVYMPFTGVPSNMMKRGIQYSPIGFGITIHNLLVNKYYNKTGFNQRQFVENITRPLTGLGVTALGFALQKAGLIKMGTGDDDDESKKLYDARTALGDQYSAYMPGIGGETNVGLNMYGNVGYMLTFGAAMASELEKEDARFGEALYNALGHNVDALIDSTFVSGLTDLFGGAAYSDQTFFEKAALVAAENIAGQMIPAWSAQLAESLDPYVRETKDAKFIEQLWNNTLNRIPIARQTLPTKVTVAGTKVRTRGTDENGEASIPGRLHNFIDPATRSHQYEEPELEEAMRLYEFAKNSGDAEISADKNKVLPEDVLRGTKSAFKYDGVEYELNDQQKEAYKLKYGEIWTAKVAEIMNGGAYEHLSDSEKFDTIKQAISKAKAETMEWAIANLID